MHLRVVDLRQHLSLFIDEKDLEKMLSFLIGIEPELLVREIPDSKGEVTYRLRHGFQLPLASGNSTVYT